MRKIRIKAKSKKAKSIDFEGRQYPIGIWLVSNQYVAAEPDCHVYYEDGKRIEDKVAVGVTSHRTADRLLHNWPDTVSEVKPAKPKKDEKEVTNE